jgi:hypothetical protein
MTRLSIFTATRSRTASPDAGSDVMHGPTKSPPTVTVTPWGERPIKETSSPSPIGSSRPWEHQSKESSSSPVGSTRIEHHTPPPSSPDRAMREGGGSSGEVSSSVSSSEISPPHHQQHHIAGGLHHHTPHHPSQSPRCDPSLVTPLSPQGLVGGRKPEALCLVCGDRASGKFKLLKYNIQYIYSTIYVVSKTSE